ncbi:MAG: hypothetical protein H7339_12435 [Arcicella sp.]|nr:hypothetical protein [Arcicella sp.]
MKFLGFPKYFLLLMLSFGVAKGSNDLSSTSQLHLLSTSTKLKEKHTKFPKFFVSEFVEEIDNNENPDETHSDFLFISRFSCAFASASNDESVIIFSISHHSLIFLSQKINVLNCIFLI